MNTTKTIFITAILALLSSAVQAQEVRYTAGKHSSVTKIIKL
jgi:hypothetical protein